DCLNGGAAYSDDGPEQSLDPRNCSICRVGAGALGPGIASRPLVPEPTQKPLRPKTSESRLAPPPPTTLPAPRRRPTEQPAAATPRCRGDSLDPESWLPLLD